jgi:hypothetical protein
MSKSSCFSCGYYKKENNGRNYCNNFDCTVDPYDPECNYKDDYEED